MMAVLAILLILHRRLNYDNLWVIGIEISIGALLLLTIGYFNRREAEPQEAACPSPVGRWQLCISGCLLLMPCVIDFLARRQGFGNGREIVMLSSLGWLSALLTINARKSRTVSLSIVCSGFLTLFSTFIADSTDAIWLTTAWGVVCLWWMVSKQWPQRGRLMAGKVQRDRSQRVATVVMGCAVFGLGCLFVANRIPVLRKVQAEIMPTSGGSSGKDSAARRGVGNGDALIAAKKHATSFGAVETNLFLDSEKPSLFDVFSEEFGEPKKKDRVELAQALSPKDLESLEGSFTEANRSSSSSEFSVERELPAMHKPIDDLVGEALFFWQGEVGAHLAVQRFDRFREDTWAAVGESAGSFHNLAIDAVPLASQTWFQRGNWDVQNSISPFIDALPEAIKFTRYDSPIIPTRAGMQLWCIDQVDRRDFFELTPNSVLQMPGRKAVPEYTVVRMINSHIDLDRLEQLVRNCSPGQSHRSARSDCEESLNALAHSYAQNTTRGWPQVESVLAGLRRDFRPTRAAQVADEATAQVPSTSALQRFLDEKQGPDYMFATAAALMLNHLGYQTRLVTGFYANPEHLVPQEHEYAVLPRDAHVWLELNVGHGYWIPLEPTPGYLAPRYSATWWYWTKQHKYHLALSVLVGGLVVWLFYLSRALLLELMIWMLQPLRWLLNDRRQVSWLVRLLDWRCRLAGMPRGISVAPRQHLQKLKPSLGEDLSRSLDECFRLADHLCYGSARALTSSQRQVLNTVWRRLTIRALKRCHAGSSTLGAI